MIVSFLGLKGGQGKSTLAVRLGSWLAAVGHRVLVVDLSPAGTASRLLGHGLVPDSGAGALMGGEEEPRRVIRDSGCPRLSLAPADAALEGFPAAAEAVKKLRSASRPFDFTLIDAPTGWDDSALIALAVGDWALVPVLADEASVAGLRRSLEWMRNSRSRFRKRASLAGVVINAHEPRSASESAIVHSLRREFRGELLKTSIRRDARWRDPASLERTWDKPKRPVGADTDLVELRGELLASLVKRS